jgi:hypothetical protein
MEQWGGAAEPAPLAFKEGGRTYRVKTVTIAFFRVRARRGVGCVGMVGSPRLGALPVNAGIFVNMHIIRYHFSTYGKPRSLCFCSSVSISLTVVSFKTSNSGEDNFSRCSILYVIVEMICFIRPSLRRAK